MRKKGIEESPHDVFKSKDKVYIKDYVYNMFKSKVYIGKSVYSIGGIVNDCVCTKLYKICCSIFIVSFDFTILILIFRYRFCLD